MDIPALSDFLQRERQARRDEAAITSLLSEEALIDRGDALSRLFVQKRSRGTLFLACDTNESRFRPGTRLDLTCGDVHTRGVVVGLASKGLLLEVQVDRKVDGLPDGPWLASEADIDMSFVVSQCLARLQPGAPGWSFFNAVSGGLSVPAPGPLDQTTCDVLDAVITEAGTAVDDSQRDVIERCAGLPQLFAVQGPPGTGKTMVLALVAETLVRLGRRVMVVAPTHQAINNALSAIHGFFPARPLLKVGDELRRESLAAAIPCRSARDATKGIPPSEHSRLIVGMTFMAALHNQALRSSGLSPNAILIDEAGQLPLTQGACTGLFGAGVNLLFGDDAQLPPVFAGDLAEDPLAVSLFKRVRQVHPALVERLNTTYRMNSDLCDVVAGEFYPGGDVPLRSALAAATKRLRLSAGPALEHLPEEVLSAYPSLVWLETPGNVDRQSNRWEADAVARIVAASMHRGSSAGEVAVVTPFRRQAALIRRHLEAMLPAGAELPIVDTVERVQGMTVDLVAISMTASDPEFIASIASFLFSPNRLNVAISRARAKAVIACSPGVFAVTPSDYAAFRAQQSLRRVLHRARTGIPLAST